VLFTVFPNKAHLRPDSVWPGEIFWAQGKKTIPDLPTTIAVRS
jgi:hypothetical protein